MDYTLSLVLTCGTKIVVEDGLWNGCLVREDRVIGTIEGAGVVTDRDGSVVQIFSFTRLVISLVLQEVVRIQGVLW